MCLKPFFLCVSSLEQARLCELEDQSKAAKKGMWSEGGGTHTIRDLKYTIENPRNFVDSLHQKPINGKDLGRGCTGKNTGYKGKEMIYKNTLDYTFFFYKRPHLQAVSDIHHFG